MPHGWEAQVLFEETTGTLLCGDLFTQVGAGPALTTDDLVGAGDGRRGDVPRHVPGPGHGADHARAGRPRPTTLAVMHGSSFQGDGKRALYDLAAAYEEMARQN